MSTTTKACILASLCVGANAFGYEGQSSSVSNWNLFVEDDWSPWGVQDMVTGDMVGFHPDLAHLVCKAAGKKCTIIGGVGGNCVDSHQEIGAGLRENTADACLGWGHTVSRHRSAKFSEGWTAETAAKIYEVAHESNDRRLLGMGDPNNPNNPAFYLEGSKVGFIGAWASDEGCLSRNGIDNRSYEAHNYESPSLALEALERGEVDFVFGLDLTTSPMVVEVDTSFQPIMCFMDSYALIAPLRSGAMVDEWSQAFDMVKESEEFYAICDKWGVACKEFRG